LAAELVALNRLCGVAIGVCSLKVLAGVQLTDLSDAIFASCSEKSKEAAALSFGAVLLLILCCHESLRCDFR
jgi:hypothetical protein